MYVYIYIYIFNVIYLITIDAHDETAFATSPMIIEQGSLADVAHLSNTLNYSLPRYCSVYNPRTRCQKVIIIDVQSVKTCEQKKLYKQSHAV